MKPINQKVSWRDWLKVGRLIPLTTVLVALTIGILTLLNLFQATLAEGIIITLLALLATDTLVERIGILEKVESQISALTTPSHLRDRSQLVRVEDMGLGATEIIAAGPTLISLLITNNDFFAQRMSEGCKLRFLLLDVNSLGAQVWDSAQRIPTTKEDSQSSLKTLDGLLRMKGVKGKCEVRLSTYLLPFSLLAINPTKDSGQMNLEFLTPKTSLANRPHLHLTKRDAEKWFNFFINQFELLWAEATKREVD